MSRNTMYLGLVGKIEAETDRAILLKLHCPTSKHHETKHWFPVSQLSSIHRTYSVVKGTFDVLMASDWIIGKNNLSLIASQKAATVLCNTVHFKGTLEKEAVDILLEDMDIDNIPPSNIDFDDDEFPF